MINFTEVCGSPLWDPDTVYSEHPDFTDCFQQTFLIWAPCFLVWVVAPIWIYMLTRQKSAAIKPSWLFICKNIFTLLLISVEIVRLVLAFRESKFTVYYVTPGVLILTYVLVLFLIHLERLKGLLSSTLIFVFFLSLALVLLITIRTLIFDENRNFVNTILFFTFYVLVVINLILSLFTEKHSVLFRKDDIEMDSEEKKQDDLKVLPENTASLLSRLCFWWINDLILTGYKRELTRKDLWKIDESESSAHLTEKLENAWNKASRKYIANLKNLPEDADETKNKSVIYKKDAKTSDEQQKLTEKDGIDISFKNMPKVKKPSFALCLCKVYAGKFLAGSLIKLVHDCLIFVGPRILDKLLSFIKDEKQGLTVGLFYTLLLFISSLVQSFLLQHYFHRMFIVGSRIRTSVSNIVFKKSLRLSTSARKLATVGEMTNLVAVNAQMFADLTTYLNIIWSAPFQIIVSLFFLWEQLGVSSLIGVGTILIFIPLNIVIGNLIKKIQLTKQKQQDSRIKMMNEILSGMKILKFYGWELSFKDIVGKIRDKELNFLKKMGLYSIFSNFLWTCAPLIITIVSFGCYIFLNGTQEFTANKVFVSLSLFNIMRFPLTVLPNIISAMIATKVSLTRISTFLLREEINESDVTYEDTGDIAVKVSHVNLGWDKSKEFFRDLNMEIPKGKLIAIVGQVGQGKSSLLSGLLGEMHKLNDGKININGKTAYVPQQAWIQNETVRNNILFGSKWNEKFYNKVLSACSLLTDLTIMPAGDKTEIGEKGINLSGGQKQRINLARSVYSNAEIYMLDDSLSAVDAHVGKHIFDNVIGPNGLLKNKTRIFVTNSLSFLPQFDEIIMLENGSIAEMGTFEELKQKQGIFNDFVKNHLNTEASKEQEIPENSVDERTIPESPGNNSTSERKLPSESVKSLNRQESTKAGVNKEEKTKVGEKIVVKEKIETGKVKFSVLMEYFRACGLVTVIGYILMYSLFNVTSVGSNVWLSKWTGDLKKNSSNAEENKYFHFLIFSLMGLAQCVLSIISDLAFLFMTFKAAKQLHNSMLFSILRSTMEFFESTPSGRIINRFSKDIDAAERAIPESFKSVCRCLFHVLFTVIVISSSTPYFLITLLPIIVVYILVQRYFVASMRQLKRMESASKSPIFSHFSETLSGVSTIRAYKSQNRFIHMMEKHLDENLLFYFPNNISNRWLALRLELIGNLISVFASFFAVLARSSITAGIAGLSITYSLNVSQTLNWLVRMTAEFETNITSVERIKEYCETPHESEYRIESTKPKETWPEQGKIDFNEFSVKYRQELENVLTNLNLSINPGEKIGIVGRTGAGKSSLTLSLFRILEYTKGNITIDNVEIKKIGLHDLRHKLTIIPQDPVIFSGTIRMNLDPLNAHEVNELWKALELAGLKDFVEGLKNQLDYECSEGGENLSVGQRQLICLARALLRKTKILILDEATASIDHNTDELIQNTIRSQFADCTVLTIAHRLNTIMDSSRILVLERGQVAEFDSPQNLLKNKNSKFYSMAKDAGLI